MPNDAPAGAAPRRLHLVDASPYIFRAFFSLPSSMTDPEGRPINAVRGFVDMLTASAKSYATLNTYAEPPSSNACRERSTRRASVAAPRSDAGS